MARDRVRVSDCMHYSTFKHKVKFLHTDRQSTTSTDGFPQNLDSVRTPTNAPPATKADYSEFEKAVSLNVYLLN